MCAARRRASEPVWCGQCALAIAAPWHSVRAGGGDVARGAGWCVVGRVAWPRCPRWGRGPRRACGVGLRVRRDGKYFSLPFPVFLYAQEASYSKNTGVHCPGIDPGTVSLTHRDNTRAPGAVCCPPPRTAWRACITLHPPRVRQQSTQQNTRREPARPTHKHTVRPFQRYSCAASQCHACLLSLSLSLSLSSCDTNLHHNSTEASTRQQALWWTRELTASRTWDP